MRRAALLLVIALPVWLFAQTPAVECKCPTVKTMGGWCPKCKVGYIAGVRIESLDLFELLDAHGHDLDPAYITCDFCKKAFTAGGYCDTCRMGFHNRLAYMSRLTYYIARGEPQDVTKVECATCRANAAKWGWCETCKRGMLGNVSIKDKSEFERAVPELQRLYGAIEMLKKCDECALAFFSGGECTKCKLSYKGGKPVSTRKP